MLSRIVFVMARSDAHQLGGPVRRRTSMENAERERVVTDVTRTATDSSALSSSRGCLGTESLVRCAVVMLPQLGVVVRDGVDPSTRSLGPAHTFSPNAVTKGYAS